MPSRLTYKDGNHSYWLKRDDGGTERATSVSALRKTLHTFEGERYHLGLAVDAANDDWDSFSELAPTARREALMSTATARASYARDFGSDVHHYCETLWKGGAVDVPELYASHVGYAARWWDDQGCALYGAELMCWDGGGDDTVPLAGRLDLLVKHPRHGLGLLDLKTWLATSSGTPRPEEWAFQLTAYADMAMIVQDDEDRPMPPIDWAAVLHVGPSGAVLWTLAGPSRRRASLQVEYARALKALAKPTMRREG